MLVGDFDQPGKTCHGAVLVQHLAQDPRRVETGKPHHVDRGLGVAVPFQHAAIPCLQREEVPRPFEVLRRRILLHEQTGAFCPVMGGYAGRHAVYGIHGYREGRVRCRRFPIDHDGDVQLCKPLFRGGQTDQPPSVHRHEVDDFGCNLLGGYHEIAFVLTVFVIDDDQHPSCSHFFHGLWNGAEMG